MIAALLVLAIAFAPQTQAQPPRDRARATRPVDPAPDSTVIERATQQEDSGAIADAEATLLKARASAPANKDVLVALAAFYNRHGNFEKAVAALEDAARQAPNDPRGYQILATFYWEKAFKDHQLLPAEQYAYVLRGIDATDVALGLKPDYLEAVTYKNLLLRMRANLETDPVAKQQLIAEADTLRARAIELNTRIAMTGANQGVRIGPAGPPPPPPPPPAAPGAAAPVRVGGNIRAPTKIKDVRPVYPPEAETAGITGVVIIEAVIDQGGKVASANILRSIPPLDQAAVDAVKQWEFTPTLLNGAPVPVVMTVTVNFTLQ